jgi:hypothetical protein
VVSAQIQHALWRTFASYLDVPEAHLLEHSALPAFEHAASDSRPGGVRIHSGEDKPAATYAAVRYRDYWFWIDHGDRRRSGEIAAKRKMQVHALHALLTLYSRQCHARVV